MKFKGRVHRRQRRWLARRGSTKRFQLVVAGFGKVSKMWSEAENQLAILSNARTKEFRLFQAVFP
jgi:hypothetical protein